MRSSKQQSSTDHAGIDCVFLTCFESELAVYSILLRSSGIRIHAADTLERLEFLLIVTGATVVISDTLFLDGSWRDAAGLLERLHPDVAFVVAVAPEDYSAVEASDIRRLRFLHRPLRMGALRLAIQQAHQNAAIPALG